jgi:hypothetical protein
MHAKTSLVLLYLGLFVGCGSKPAQAPTPDPTSAPTAASTADMPAPPSTAGTATPSTSGIAAKDPASSGGKKDWDDPDEIAAGSIVTMTPLIQKGAKTAYPKRTIGDKECWQGTALAGEAKKDYDTLIGKCGAATGLAEYVKPATGKLHHLHDKRDTFKLKLLGGMCYRYFAVADSGIKDLDILVMKPGGALVADDKTSNPVAIIEFDKSWCMDEDAEYDFHIEVDGEGNGHYIFGVWAKPKSAK